MPFEGDHSGDVGLLTPDGPVCKYDSENGKIKTPQEIFQGGIDYFVGAATDGDRPLAERLTRRNMNHLPYWQKHPFPELEGPEATDDEYGLALAKL